MHGTGMINSNGQKLLELCSNRGSCIKNTFFKCKPQHKVTWCHPRSKRWHNLDIITRRTSLRSILNSRSYHSANCETDHTLARCPMRLQPRQFHRSKFIGRPRVDTARTVKAKRRQVFAKTLDSSLQNTQKYPNGTEKWNSLKDAIYNASVSAFGKRANNNQNWFNANLPHLNR